MNDETQIPDRDDSVRVFDVTVRFAQHADGRLHLADAPLLRHVVLVDDLTDRQVGSEDGASPPPSGIRKRVSASSGLISRGIGSGAWACFKATTIGVSAVNGTLPVASSYTAPATIT